MKRLALLVLLITAANGSLAEDLTKDILNICNGYASIAASMMKLRQVGWPIEKLYRRAKDDTGREIIPQAYALPMVDDPNQQAYLSKIFLESTFRQCRPQLPITLNTFTSSALPLTKPLHQLYLFQFLPTKQAL